MEENIFQRIRNFVAYSDRKRIFGFIVVIALIAAIPLLVKSSQQQQETRQHASESQNLIPSDLAQAIELTHEGKESVYWVDPTTFNAAPGETYTLQGTYTFIDNTQGYAEIRADIYNGETFTGRSYKAPTDVCCIDFTINEGERIKVIKKLMTTTFNQAKASFSIALRTTVNSQVLPASYIGNSLLVDVPGGRYFSIDTRYTPPGSYIFIGSIESKEDLIPGKGNVEFNVKVGEKTYNPGERFILSKGEQITVYQSVIAAKVRFSQLLLTREVPDSPTPTPTPTLVPLGGSVTVCPEGSVDGQDGCDFVGNHGIQKAIEASQVGSAQQKTKISIKNGQYILPEVGGNAIHNNYCALNTREKNIIFEGENKESTEISVGQHTVQEAVICATNGEIEVKNLKITQSERSYDEGLALSGSAKAIISSSILKGGSGNGVLSLRDNAIATVTQSNFDQPLSDISLYDSSQATFESNSFKESTIRLNGNSRTLIKNNRFEEESAITSSDSSDSEVKTNTFVNSYVRPQGSSKVDINHNSFNTNREAMQIAENAQVSITSNTIDGSTHTGRFSGIHIQHNTQVLLIGNKIFGFLSMGISTFNNSKVTLKNNLIYSNGDGNHGGDNDTRGILVTGEQSEITAINNVFYSNDAHGIAVQQAKKADIRNNIFIKNGTKNADTTYGYGISIGNRSNVPNQTIAYNLFYQNKSGCISELTNCTQGSSLDEDPRFSNESTKDFRLKSTSPAKNAGDPSISDLDGSRSDIGAYGGPDSALLETPSVPIPVESPTPTPITFPQPTIPVGLSVKATLTSPASNIPSSQPVQFSGTITGNQLRYAEIWVTKNDGTIEGCSLTVRNNCRVTHVDLTGNSGEISGSWSVPSRMNGNFTAFIVATDSLNPGCQYDGFGGPGREPGTAGCPILAYINFQKANDTIIVTIPPTPTNTPVATTTVTPGQSQFESADVDHNGCVGIVDFSIWLAAFRTGTIVPGTYPDTHPDGNIDILDFGIWFNAIKTLPADKLCS